METRARLRQVGSRLSLVFALGPRVFQYTFTRTPSPNYPILSLPTRTFSTTCNNLTSTSLLGNGSRHLLEHHIASPAAPAMCLIRETRRAFNRLTRALFSNNTRPSSPPDKHHISADAPIHSGIPSSVAAEQPVAQIPQEFRGTYGYLGTELDLVTRQAGLTDGCKQPPHSSTEDDTPAKCTSNDRDRPLFPAAASFQKQAREEYGPNANPSNSFFGTNGVGPNDPVDKLFESYRGSCNRHTSILGNSSLPSF
jgi:hypothetical protein